MPWSPALALAGSAAAAQPNLAKLVLQPRAGRNRATCQLLQRDGGRASGPADARPLRHEELPEREAPRRHGSRSTTCARRRTVGALERGRHVQARRRGAGDARGARARRHLPAALRSLGRGRAAADVSRSRASATRTCSRATSRCGSVATGRQGQARRRRPRTPSTSGWGTCSPASTASAATQRGRAADVLPPRCGGERPEPAARPSGVVSRRRPDPRCWLPCGRGGGRSSGAVTCRTRRGRSSCSRRTRSSGPVKTTATTPAGTACAPIRSRAPRPGCTYVAEFMTAAHLVLVWQERDDPNLLRHARSCEGGRPQPARRHVRAGLRPERLVLRVGGGGPSGARHPRQVDDRVALRRVGAADRSAVEEELMILDAATLSPPTRSSSSSASRDGARPAGDAQDGAARVRRRAEHRRLRRRDGGDRRPCARSARRPTRIAARERPRDRRSRHAPDRAVRVAAGRAGEALSRRWSSDVGYAARRQGVNGLHVHVGVESAERVLRAARGGARRGCRSCSRSPRTRRSSEGDRTGMQSNRARSCSPSCRAAGAPPAFGSYAAWEAWVERLASLGVIDDHTRIWWDVRPHPRFGTLEVRIADQPTSLERTALLAELIVVARRALRAAPGDPAARGDYLQNRWAAARSGLDAELIHPDGDRVVSRARARRASSSAGSRPSPRRCGSSRSRPPASTPSRRTSWRGR